MTNLEALKSATNYPVQESKLQKILIDNGLIDSDRYEGTSKQFELATAAVYVLLITSANISEGDYSINLTEKTTIANLAASIYSKYGMPNPLKEKSKIRNRSNCW